MELNLIPIIINIFNIFNNILSFIYVYVCVYIYEEKEIELCIDCQITKRVNRTKTPKIENYKLSRYYRPIQH